MRRPYVKAGQTSIRDQGEAGAERTVRRLPNAESKTPWQRCCLKNLSQGVRGPRE